VTTFTAPLKSRCNILRSPDLEWRYFDTNSASRRLGVIDFTPARGIGNIRHDCQAAKLRDHFTQEFESLAGKIGGEQRHACDVATRLLLVEGNLGLRVQGLRRQRSRFRASQP